MLSLYPRGEFLLLREFGHSLLSGHNREKTLSLPEI
jgi:hypothetical protein